MTDTLKGFEGVKQAKVDLRKNEAVVKFDPGCITREKLTKAVTKVGFNAAEKTEYTLLKLLTVSLILIFSVIGCSEVPYTGPVLQVDHVDRYLDSVGEDTICLQDGFDSICLKNVPGEDYDAVYDVSIVHVYPTSLIFMFYYADSLILRAERKMDTTQIVQELIDAGMVQLPANGGTNGNVPEEWIIQIYYPDSFPEANRGQTLKTSGLDIKVAEGMQQMVNKQDELAISDFVQFDGDDGTRGVQFSVDSKAKEITIQVNKLISGYTAKFYLNVDGIASDEGTNPLQLIPLQ